jgi:hypothetical protein
MKLNLDYYGDPRWEQMSETHKKSLPIPNLFISLLYQYQNEIPNLSDINFAIETGTHDARTSIFLAEHFDVAFTVELFPDRNPYDGRSYRELYQEIGQKYENLTFLFGTSEDTLKSVLEELPDERFFILLDAHSMLDGPLTEELKSIKSASNRNDHVMLIDDCRDLGQGNFPTLSEFETLLRDINPNYNIINTKEGNHIYLIY